MSLDLQTALKVFLASAPQTSHQVQTLEFKHSAFATQVICREPGGVSITTEEGVLFAQPVNFAIKLAGTELNLDQKYQITLDLTDINDTFRAVLDSVPVTTSEKIQCIYREYLSSDLTTYLARGVLQVDTIAYTVGAATITAVSPRFNMNSTGERYIPREVPMLRGFIYGAS